MHSIFWQRRKLQNSSDDMSYNFPGTKKTLPWSKRLSSLETAKDYIVDPEKYVRLFSVKINGKLRHLVTYQPSKEGRDLRELHTDFSRYIGQKYSKVNSSYAYKKGRDILDCVNRHLKSELFLKTDIHAYFDSVTYANMMDIIKKLRIGKKDMSAVAQIAEACFYDGRLPLGFTSSPVLSDLFLSSLDRQYQRIEGITYTRYADDFIVSASGPDSMEKLVSFRLQLEKDLGTLDLELNRKKTYIRHLKAPGDAIHVLGLNIVRTESGPNRITVSDGYVRETCRSLCDWLSGADLEGDGDEFFSRVFGQISFIRQCSVGSYEKLAKMTSIKCGYRGPLTADPLKKERERVLADIQ